MAAVGYVGKISGLSACSSSSRRGLARAGRLPVPHQRRHLVGPLRPLPQGRLAALAKDVARIGRARLCREARSRRRAPLLSITSIFETIEPSWNPFPLRPSRPAPGPSRRSGLRSRSDRTHRGRRGGGVRPAEGSVYPLLGRLEEGGLIRRLGPRPQRSRGRARVDYELTVRGVLASDGLRDALRPDGPEETSRARRPRAGRADARESPDEHRAQPLRGRTAQPRAAGGAALKRRKGPDFKKRRCVSRS